MYAWLLEPRAEPRLRRRRALPAPVAGGEHRAAVPAGPAACPSGPQQVVPVRFAADQHAALRAWCAEHGFSMATVVRGLVARFLEGQLPARD